MPFITLSLSVVLFPLWLWLLIQDASRWPWILGGILAFMVIESGLRLRTGKTRNDRQMVLKAFKDMIPSGPDVTAGKVATGILGLLVVIFIAWKGASFFLDTSPKAEDPNADKSIAACTCAQQRIKTMLKAPSTAKFGSCHDAVVRLGGQRYAVASYVDAQNGFGAMIRNSFNCDVTVEAGSCVTQCSMGN